jgi:hypothetical protein
MKSPKWLEQVIGSVCTACINDVKGRMSGLSRLPPRRLPFNR